MRGWKKAKPCWAPVGSTRGAGEAAIVGAALPAHRRRPLLDDAALRIGGGKEDADRVVGEARGEERGEPRIDRARQIVEADLGRGDQGHVVAIVERPRGLQIDGGAERAFLDIGGGGLADGDRIEQLGREDVEIELAAAIGAAGSVRAAGGAQPFEAVDPDSGESRAEAAHRDVAPLALIAGDRDAGNALDRFGEVVVGEVRNVFRADHVDDARRLALVLERRVQRGAKAGDDDRLLLARRPGSDRFDPRRLAPGHKPGSRRAPAAPRRPAGRARMRRRGVMSSFEVICHSFQTERARRFPPPLTPVSIPVQKKPAQAVHIGPKDAMASMAAPFPSPQVPRFAAVAFSGHPIE